MRRLTILMVLLLAAECWGAFPVGWNKRCPVTIAAGQAPSSVSSFTLLFTEANLPAGILTDARGDGGDIRVSTSSDGSGQLAVDVITPPSTGKVVMRCGTVTVSGASQTIYIWYGNSGQVAELANATYGQYAAYDSNWKAYWPLGGTADRTSNQNTLTASGTPGTATGKVGTASTYNGTTYHYCNSSVIGNTQQPWTMMAWVNGASQADKRVMGIGSSTSDNPILSMDTYSGDGSKLALFARNDSSFGFATGGNNEKNGTVTAFDSTWHHAAVSMATSASNVTVDGGTPAIGSPTYSGTNTMNRTAIGALLRSIPAAKFTGSINEAQIHSAARSADWITLEYKQTSAPATFASAGSVDTIGGATLLIPVVMHHIATNRGR